MKTAAFVLTLALWPGLLAAAELIDRGYFNGWNVMVDPNLGNGCLMQSVPDGESLVRIGYDPQKDEGYLTVFNPDWHRVTTGTKQPMVFDLDGRQYPAKVTNLKVGGVSGFGVTFPRQTGFEQIARTKMMTVFNPKGEAVYQLDLSKTGDAFAEARKCQKEMG